jgi:hypothetical protein
VEWRSNAAGKGEEVEKSGVVRVSEAALRVLACQRYTVADGEGGALARQPQHETREADEDGGGGRTSAVEEED